MSARPGIVESVNVGELREIERDGRTELTGIWKRPVAGPVAVRGASVAGDKQGDDSVHGGPDKAVYAYSAEDYEWWRIELGRQLAPGTFGENLTLRDVDVTGALIGERWRVGSALLEVSEPRFPCWKLAARMDDERFVKRFSRALRPGAYLRIVDPGELAAGDAVTVESRPDTDVTIELFARAYLEDHSLARDVLSAPALAARWRDRFSRRAT